MHGRQSGFISRLAISFFSSFLPHQVNDELSFLGLRRGVTSTRSRVAFGQRSPLHLFTTAGSMGVRPVAVWGGHVLRCAKLATSTNARVQESSTRSLGAAMRLWFGVSRFVCATLCAHLLSSTCALADIELFISPTGNDRAAGTAAAPLATLAGAQMRLREMRADKPASGDAQVWIAEGLYELHEPLEFTAQDNASDNAATTYEALPGHRVIVRGGCTIPAHAWQKSVSDQRIPYSAREHVRVVDLSAVEVEQVDSDHPRRARHATMHPVPLELFCGDKRLPVAAWPNEGWAKVESPDNQQLSWNIAGLRPVQSSAGVRAHGFWQHDWQDSCEPISLKTIPSGKKRLSQATVDTAHASHVKAIRQDARFRIENLLSELDMPGEWYHDTEQHCLFAWLPDHAESNDLFVSTIDTPVSMYDVENLTLRGLTIEGARACCVEIAGGKQVCLEYCQIRHAGNLGMHVYHGQRHTVSHCEITSTGAGAIRVDGGHRETLLSCEHVIEHNRLHDYAQLQLAYRPAVNVYGVGVTVHHNAIFDAPHAAIVLHGNEHVIEHNDIHHVCQETDDVGAIYLAHNPTYRGNSIRFNHIHDLGGFSQTGVIGIYLDDFASGTLVTHNVLERAGRGVAIGGGRDNVVENNVFLDCLAAVQIDCRGTTWAESFVKGNRSPYHEYLSQIEEVLDVYTERYPELTALLSDSPELAKGNRIERNVFDSAIGIDLHDGLDEKVVQVRDNLAEAKLLLVEGHRLAPRPDSAAARAGFEAIELESGSSKTAGVFVKRDGN